MVRRSPSTPKPPIPTDTVKQPQAGPLQKLVVPPPDANPIEALCGLARLWMQAGVGATGDGYAAQFETTAGRVLLLAKQADLLGVVLLRIEDLRTAIQDYKRSFRLGVLEVLKLQKQGFRGIPFLRIGAQIEALLVELKQFSPLLCAPPAQEPLTDAQQRVWNLLERRALSAKEFRTELKLAHISDAAIRGRISKIQRSGRSIEHKVGIGYYRPDAPPVGLSISPT